MMNKHYFKRGFTIVELLIVIVIIGILATLTIVAYNGVQQSARDKSILSDLDNMDAVQTQYATRNNVIGKAYYSGSGVDVALDFTPSPSNVIDVVINASDYCIRGYNVSASAYNSLTNAAIKESTSGACASIPASAAAIADSPVAPPVQPIVNLSSNPSVETNTTGFGVPNGSTIARDTSKSMFGSASLRATMPIYASNSVGSNIISSYAVPATLPLNTTYMVSAYVYVPTGTVDVRLSIQGTGKQTVSYGASDVTSVKDNWVMISQIFTTITSGSGTITIYVLNNAATTVAGTQFWIDGVLLTNGSTLYNYADGTYTSSGWSWTGTANNSTSTGPPL